MLRACLPVAVGAVAIAVAGAAFGQTAQTAPGHAGRGADEQPAPANASGAYLDGGYDDDREPTKTLDRDRGGDERSSNSLQAPDFGHDLGLRSDQLDALQTYRQATMPTELEQRQALADEQRLSSMTTPQRLDFAASQMRRDEGDFARRADAVRRFYGQLTPAQQRRFDQLTAPGGEGGRLRGEDGPEDARPTPPR